MQVYGISFMHLYKESGRCQDVFVVVCTKYTSKIKKTRTPPTLRLDHFSASYSIKVCPVSNLSLRYSSYDVT